MASFAGFAAFIVALVALLATRTPVAVALGLIGIVGTFVFVSPQAIRQVANIAFTQSSSFVLTVVPLFVLMGEALAATRIGYDLFQTAQMWLRRIPGALAVGTVFACAIFAAVCGSSPVTAATIGAMAVPEMIRRGYDKSLALGTTAAGGTLGILIPPSVPMILYGVITDTSIGDLFIAGILPGIMMAVLFSGTVILRVLLRPELAPPLKERTPWPVKWRALGSIAPVIVLSALVIGSIYGGVATPTEAGAVGAAGALAVAGAMRYLNWPVLRRILDNTVKTTAMFLLLLIGGLFSSFVLTRLGIPQGMSNFLTGLDMPPWMIIVLINILLLVLGMFLDPTSVLVIVVPIFFKAVVALGYHPVWFGILVTIQIEIAAITPPVGFNLFVLRSVVPNTELADVVRGAAIFVAPLVAGIALLMIFPGIALFLPSLMR
jgi:C4-dicarboxylate transporter DctM subunit